MAPVVRLDDDGDRRLEMVRWGMPGLPQFGGRAVTNIRNTHSSHWRRWLGPATRCLVPGDKLLRMESNHRMQLGKLRTIVVNSAITNTIYSRQSQVSLL